MPMQKPSRLLPDDSHHLMATDCVLPQVALWGKGMVCALKRTSGLNGWISNQKHISLQSVALREGSRGFEVYKAGLLSQVYHPQTNKCYYDITVHSHHHLFYLIEIVDYEDPELTQLIQQHLEKKNLVSADIEKIQVQITVNKSLI